MTPVVMVALLVRTRMRHETFVWIHRVLGLAFVLAAVHALSVGGAISRSGVLRAYMIIVVAVGLTALVGHAVLGRLVHRHLYRVDRVRRLGYELIELIVSPAHADRLHHTMAKLDASGIYLRSEVNGLVDDFLAHKGNNALTRWITPARDRFRDRERTALGHNDKHALGELELFRKDVRTFLRQYDFLSQIVDYEDPSLEKLSIYLRHLAPQITSQQLNHEIDLSTVEFDYITHREQATTSLKPGTGVPLQPVKDSGTGTIRDPEMVSLDEVIEQINDLFSGDHSDSSVRNVVTHIKDRLEESDVLQQQAQNNSLTQFSASPDLHNEFLSAVIAAMHSSADLSEPILNNPELSEKLLGELAVLTVGSASLKYSWTARPPRVKAVEKTDPLMPVGRSYHESRVDVFRLVQSGCSVTTRARNCSQKSQ